MCAVVLSGIGQPRSRFTEEGNRFTGGLVSKCFENSLVKGVE
jgi:hypothetical protein